MPSSDPRTVGELAHEAEQAVCDGAFYWDGIAIDDEIFDP